MRSLHAQQGPTNPSLRTDQRYTTALHRHECPSAGRGEAIVHHRRPVTIQVAGIASNILHLDTRSFILDTGCQMLAATIPMHDFVRVPTCLWGHQRHPIVKSKHQTLISKSITFGGVRDHPGRELALLYTKTQNPLHPNKAINRKPQALIPRP